MKDDNIEPDQKTTLSDFIETNHKLISTLGIFTALAVFAANLPLKAFGYFLSFIFMATTIVIWSEIFGRFPAKDASFRLSIFENLTSATILLVVANWFVQFASVWEGIIEVPMMIITLICLLQFGSWVIKKYNLFNRIFRTEPGEKRRLRYLVGILAIIFSFLVAIAISNLLKPKAIWLLNIVADGAKEFGPR